MVGVEVCVPVAVAVGGMGVAVGVGGTDPADVPVGVAVAADVPATVPVAVAAGVLGGHPPVHASQQLGQLLIDAVPPRGALHFAASFLTEHLILPVAVVRQQVT
jgi:hypothetical protein